MTRELDIISAALDELERVQGGLSAVADRTDDRRRHDLIEMRRRLSQQIAETGRLAEPLFSTLPDADLARTYRSKFSAMRSAAALHQANWPAVALDESPEAYRQSAQTVRTANRDFIDWMRATIAILTRKLG